MPRKNINTTKQWQCVKYEADTVLDQVVLKGVLYFWERRFLLAGLVVQCILNTSGHFFGRWRFLSSGVGQTPDFFYSSRAIIVLNT